MCRAFQTAAAVSVREVANGARPIEARWSFTSRSTSAACAELGAGQPPSGAQSPTTAARAAETSRGVDDVDGTTSATRSAAAHASRSGVRVPRRARAVPVVVHPRVFSPMCAKPPLSAWRTYKSRGGVATSYG
jgi:hypothetical protein